MILEIKLKSLRNWFFSHSSQLSPQFSIFAIKLYIDHSPISHLRLKSRHFSYIFSSIFQQNTQFTNSRWRIDVKIIVSPLLDIKNSKNVVRFSHNRHNYPQINTRKYFSDVVCIRKHSFLFSTVRLKLLIFNQSPFCPLTSELCCYYVKEVEKSLFYNVIGD